MNFEWFYSVDAPYAKILGVQHICYMIFCFLTIFLTIKYHKQVKANFPKIKKVIFGLLLFQQVVLLYGWYVVVTDFDVTVALPLHICRIASLLTIVFLINGNKKLLDIIFLFSLFAIGSFFYPMQVYHLAHMNGISYMINHLITVLIPIYGVIAYRWRPSFKGLKRALIAFTCYFVTVYTINPMLNSNYFYLVERPFFNSLSYNTYSFLVYFGVVSLYTLIIFVITRVMFEYKIKVTIPRRAQARMMANMM